MIISSNLSPQVSLTQVQARETLSKSLARREAAGAVDSAAHSSSTPATTLDVDTQLRRLDQAQQQVGNAVSFTQSQDGYLRKMGAAFDQMSKLAGQAQDPALSDAERTRHQAEYTQLGASVRAAAAKDFNGASLFSGDSLQVVVDGGGNTLTLPGVDLSNNLYTGALQGRLDSPSAAQNAFNQTQLALTQLSQDRAAIGSNQSRLNVAADQLAVGKENLNAAVPSIRDADAAEQSTFNARRSILAQSGAAMLAQANAMPQSALRLLP